MAVHSKQLSHVDEQESVNFLKFTKIVVDELTKALRRTFKVMWNKKFGQGRPWDDSVAVRNFFQANEGGKTKCKVPTNQSYEKWDCTALFAATIFARSFALPDKKGHLKTLNELYVKPRRLPDGTFHASVMSLGNTSETFALAIDQLRRLRNLFSHSTSTEMDKITFDQCVKRAKDAFQALGVKTDSIDAVAKSHFLTTEVDTSKGKICDMRSFFFFFDPFRAENAKLAENIPSIPCAESRVKNTNIGRGRHVYFASTKQTETVEIENENFYASLKMLLNMFEAD